MSWQSYVDDQLLATGQVADAIIMGHDGNAWATSAGANAKPEQLKAIVTNFGDIPTLAQNGITIGDTKYMFLSASDKVIRGKRNQNGIHIMKTVQAIIIAIYKEPTMPEQCATVTEKLGEYLISVGY